jgi:hypothetical protein
MLACVHACLAIPTSWWIPFLVFGAQLDARFCSAFVIDDTPNPISISWASFWSYLIPHFFLPYPICEGIWNMFNLLLRAFRGTWVGVGAATPRKKIEIFWTRPKIIACLAWFWRKHCTCILEGHLLTYPILSALHLQGLESNLYVYFYLINKQFD